MKIKVQREDEVEITLPKHWKSCLAVYKKLSDDGVMEVFNDSILIKSRMHESDVIGLQEITPAEFGAAYVQAVQRIREAYLS